nr:unnamed protein product [Digitaria exilis]
MSAPPAPPHGAPTWPPPSGGAISISSEPNSPSSGGSTSSPALGSSSIVSWSPPQPTARAAPSGGSTPATPLTPGCAACKHKRQKCPPGCVLLPYFPAGEPDKFRNVLRVFGVKNLLRTLREVPRPRWDACVRALVYESRTRLADPVRGLAGAIEDLEGSLMDTAVELVVLRRRLQSNGQARRQQALIINPILGHGPAAASPQGEEGVTNPNLGVAWQRPGRMTRDDVMPPEGPYYGDVWPPTAMAGLTATPPQLFSAMPPQFSATPAQLFSAMPPQVYATTQAQFLATQPQQFSAAQTQLPQLPAMQQQLVMRRQPTRGESTAMERDDGFVGNNPWANDDDRIQIVH